MTATSIDPVDPVDRDDLVVHGKRTAGPVDVDVCVIGGGQSGLAVGYHLRRLVRNSPDTHGDLSFVILDGHPHPGGAWQEAWDTLHLFSPATYSSLAGWPMPPWHGDDNPDAAHVVEYLGAYEKRYDLPVERPVTVTAVTEHVNQRGGERLLVTASDGRTWSTRVLINATGTWQRPFWPYVPGMADFTGRQLHTVDYRTADEFTGARVIVVGGGNSGAQIAADLQHEAKTVTWVAKRPPRMLPDDVDGRVLFETATRAVRDRAAGIANDGVGDLGDIVAVPSVRHARDEYGLRAEPMFDRLVATGARWADGHTRDYDAIIWATGFRPALRHLEALGLRTRQGRPLTVTPGVLSADLAQQTSPVVAANDPRVLFVGYGAWCGSASATLIGVNHAAKDTAATAAWSVAHVS